MYNKLHFASIYGKRGLGVAARERERELMDIGKHGEGRRPDPRGSKSDMSMDVTASSPSKLNTKTGAGVLLSPSSNRKWLLQNFLTTLPVVPDPPTGSPLSALLIRLAAVVDRSGRSSAEHRYVVWAVKRYFSGAAHRLWPKRR